MNLTIMFSYPLLIVGMDYTIIKILQRLLIIEQN